MKKIFLSLLFLAVPFVSQAAAPAVPTDLVVSPILSQQLAVSWTAPFDGGSPITDYQLEYRLEGEIGWVMFADTISPAPGMLVEPLLNGREYDLRVSAVNIDGISSPSDSVAGIPIDPVPTAPMALDVAVSGDVYDGSTLVGLYDYVDVNADPEGPSLYQWFTSNAPDGGFSPIPGADEITYTLTASDIGMYLKFQVTPISLALPGLGEPVQSDATEQVLAANYINQILSTGQSVSIGTKAIPPLSTTQPYNNMMLTGHPSSGWGAGTDLVPLVEAHWETPGSGMANMLSYLNDEDFDVAIGLHGYNAVPYTSIMQGTGLYNKGMLQLANTKAAAEALGRPHRVLGVTVIHGETDDYINTPGDVYAGYLEEFQADYEADIQAVTGQTETIPMFTDQESSFTSDYYVNKETSEIPLAQLQASLDNPGKIVLVAPKYFIEYDPDGAHLTAKSSRWLGEYYGKVINEVVVRGNEWKPLMPEAGMLFGNTLYLDYHVPAGELVIDTSIVAEHEDYGFEYYDDTESIDIVDVEIIGDTLVKITLSGTPTGTDKKIRYAYRGVQGTHTDPMNPDSVGGNLRDTDDAPSLHGNTLYNWAVQGEWDIEELPAIAKKKKKFESKKEYKRFIKKFRKLKRWKRIR